MNDMAQGPTPERWQDFMPQGMTEGEGNDIQIVTVTET